MTRVQKNLAFALILLAGGGGALAYTLKTKIKTADERFKDARDAQRLFHFGRAHVEKARLQTATATFTVVREGAGWLITDPVKWPAETEAVDAMLDRMAGIISDPVVTEDATPEELSRAGLDHPPTRLDVDLEKGVHHTLFVGPKNKMVEKYPITDAKKKRIGLSDTAFHWAMARGFSEFRDKRLFPLDAGEIAAVEIKEGDKLHVGLDLKGEGWWVRGEGLDAPIQADMGTVGVLLVALTKRTKVERFLSDSFDPSAAGPKAYGLSTPEFTVVLTTKSGEHRTVTFAPYAETGAEEGTYVAHVADSTTVVALSTGATAPLLPPAPHYRDRTLSRFSPSAVKKVRIEIAGEASALLTTDGEHWHMTSPTDAQAKVWKVDAVVRPFAALRVVSWKTDAATAQQRTEWLLEPWSRRVVVYGEGDAVLADVRIGNLADDDLVFATVANDPRVGLIPAKKIRAFPQHVQDLLTD